MSTLSVADKATGNITICSVDSFSSRRQGIDAAQEFSKFLVKCQPKVICSPNIVTDKPNPLICQITVKSVAANILANSSTQLFTLHSYQCLRLWNIDDGRCTLQSSPTIFDSKPLGMTKIGNFPDMVAVVGSNEDLYITCVSTMSVQKKLKIEGAKGFSKVISDQDTLLVIDSVGTHFLLKDKSFHMNKVYVPTKNE